MDIQKNQIVNNFSKHGSDSEIPTTNYVNDGLKEAGLTILDVFDKYTTNIKYGIEEERKKEKIKKKEELHKIANSSKKTNNVKKRKSIL